MYKLIAVLLMLGVLMTGCDSDEGSEVGNLLNIQEMIELELPNSWSGTYNSNTLDELEGETDAAEYVTYTNAAIEYIKTGDIGQKNILMSGLGLLSEENQNYLFESLEGLRVSEDAKRLLIPIDSTSDVLMSIQYREILDQFAEYNRLAALHEANIDAQVEADLANSLEGMTEEQADLMRQRHKEMLQVEAYGLPTELANLGMTEQEVQVLYEQALVEESAVKDAIRVRLEGYAASDSRLMLEETGLYILESKITAPITLELGEEVFNLEPAVRDISGITSDTEFMLMSAKSAFNRAAVRYIDYAQNIQLDFKFHLNITGEIERLNFQVKSVQEKLEIRPEAQPGVFTVHVFDDGLIKKAVTQVHTELQAPLVIDVTNIILQQAGEWDSWGDKEVLLTAYLFNDLDPAIQLTGLSRYTLQAQVDITSLYDAAGLPVLLVGDYLIDINAAPEVAAELQRLAFIGSEVELYSYNLFENGFLRLNFRAGNGSYLQQLVKTDQSEFDDGAAVTDATSVGMSVNGEEVGAGLENENELLLGITPAELQINIFVSPETKEILSFEYYFK